MNSLANKVKLLEGHIEELNADRNKLSAIKDDLTLKLEEYEADVHNQNEALQLATIQFNTEKRQLMEDNQRARIDLRESLELKKCLEQELEMMRRQLTEKQQLCDQLSMEKSFLEKQASKESIDALSMKRENETELNALKKEIKELGKNLTVTEVKLVSAEKEYQYLKSQIREREKLIEELKNELGKQKAEITYNLGLLEKERQDKERLIKRCESLEDTLKGNIDEVDELRRPTKSNLQSASAGGIDAERVAAIEAENRKLMSEYTKLTDKLQRTEQELNAFRSESFLVKSNKADKLSPSELLFEVGDGESTDTLKVG